MTIAQWVGVVFLLVQTHSLSIFCLAWVSGLCDVKDVSFLFPIPALLGKCGQGMSREKGAILRVSPAANIYLSFH